MTSDDLSQDDVDAGRRDTSCPPQRQLFRIFPDPLIHYEVKQGTAVIRAVNPAFERAFDVNGPAVTDDRLVDHLLAETDENGPDPRWVSLDSADDPADIGDGSDPEVEPDVEDLLSQLDEDDRVTLRFYNVTDRTWRYFRLETVASPDAHTGRYVVYTDITDLRRQVRDLATRADRLERVVSITAHDLRNPLEVAKIRLKAARDTGEDVHFEKVEKALDRIQEIIQNVLSVSGAEVDSSDAVALDSLVESAWSTVETADATLVLEDDLPTIEADADTLQQVFENLFRNAVEHSSQTVTVTVGSLADGFYLADDGPGIPPTERDRAFEPGYSTAENNTGLGLAIVEQIAEDHGWEIALTASDAGGARFAFTGVETGGHT